MATTFITFNKNYYPIVTCLAFKDQLIKFQHPTFNYAGPYSIEYNKNSCISMAAAVTTTMKYARNGQKRGRLEYSYVQIDINGKEGYGEES